MFAYIHSRPGRTKPWRTLLILIVLAGFTESVHAQGGPLRSIEITPAEITLQVGQSQEFTAEGKDEDGNTVAIPDPQWTVNGGGTISCDGAAAPVAGGKITDCSGGKATLTATTAGNFQISCYDNSGTGADGSATLHITAEGSQLTQIVISPSQANLQVGQEQEFMAGGKDQGGTPVTISNPQWSVNGGGTLSGSGDRVTFTATDVGNYTLTCRDGGSGIEGNASLHITPATQLTQIVISPSQANLQVGQSQTFTAEGKDQNGNRFPTQGIANWTVSNGGILGCGGSVKISCSDTTVTFTATTLGDYLIICTDSSDTTIADSAAIHIFSSTSVDHPVPIPTVFHLAQSHPNPVREIAVIPYALPNTSRVRLAIYTMQGRRVRTLVDNEQGAGFYRVTWDGCDEAGRRVASGVYLYRLEAGRFRQSLPLVLVK